MGVLVALIYHALTRLEGGTLSETFTIGSAFFASAVINTVLFFSFFLVLFGRSDFVREMQGATTLLAFGISLIGLNGIAEALVATVAGTLIVTALMRARQE